MTTPHRTIVVAGPGTVIRWPGAVVVLGVGDASVTTCIAHLTADSQDPPAAGLLIERLRSLTSHDFAAAVETPAGRRLLHRGAVRAILLDATTVAATDAEPDATVEFDVDATASPIWLGAGEPVAGGPGGNGAGPDHLDLTAGIVPGRGVLLDTRRATPAVTPAASSFQIADLGSPVEAIGARTALPEAAAIERGHTATPVDEERDDEVMGIECSRRHFNNPIAAYCQVCGISMIHLTHHLVPGIRPTLGFIVFDDGATYALDRSYIIGREPTPVLDSSRAPLVADDLDHTVSRDHAELSFDGWDVVVADLGSTNGTFRWDTATARWERVLPNHPVVIAPGASVAVGRKTFVYEAVARSA